MNSTELKPKIETKEEKLETYTDFKKKYYIYRVDDIIDYLQRDNTELSKLCKREEKIFKDLKEILNPEQQNLLSKYSDTWMDLVTEGVDELTQYILNDFEEEK